VPFSFNGNPSLVLKYSDPNLRAADLGVQTAQWRGKAGVKVKNENGKTWRIGFAQLLEKNMMQAIYTKHKRSEVLISPATMPVLDADDNPAYRPFYDDNTASKAINRPKDVSTTVGQPEIDVEVGMWDEPESDYDWWFNGDATDPLVEFVMSLQFSTYIVARDITNGGGINDPFVLKILRQWDVVLDRRYEFKVVRDTTQPGLKADLTKTTCTIKNPARQPFVNAVNTPEFPKNSTFIFKGSVANDVFTDEDTGIAERSVGELVKARKAMFGG
jgi:hypothetical protein